MESRENDSDEHFQSRNRDTDTENGLVNTWSWRDTDTENGLVNTWSWRRGGWEEFRE